MAFALRTEAISLDIDPTWSHKVLSVFTIIEISLKELEVHQYFRLTVHLHQIKCRIIFQ
jgi:hypothetical protein